MRIGEETWQLYRSLPQLNEVVSFGVLSQHMHT